MREWLAKQYDDIRGHFKWALLGLLWAPLIAAVKALLTLIPHIPNWTVWTILLLVSAVAFVWIAKSQKQSGQLPEASIATVPTSKLVIHSANYAAIDGPGPKYDVTEFMRQIIAGTV
jgi:hypothetical protein